MGAGAVGDVQVNGNVTATGQSSGSAAWIDVNAGSSGGNISVAAPILASGSSGFAWVTLNTYGHIFPSLEESLTHALDDVYRTAEPAPPAKLRKIERG